MRLRPVLRTLRQGDALGRVAALRSANRAVSVAVVGSALRTGVLEALVEAPLTAADVAARRGWDAGLVEPYLQVLAAHRLLRRRGELWRATPRGRRVAGDDVVRAVYEAFSGYHTQLYREIEPLLAGRVRRGDIAGEGALIARLSNAMNEFVSAELAAQVEDAPPRRMLDVGCGSAAHLIAVLGDAPGATGVGVETDSSAAGLARRAVRDAGLEGRTEVVESDVRAFLDDRPAERFDLVLLANVIYYVPFSERVQFLKSLVDRIEVGGRLVAVTTALTDSPFSRHFDLLLRAQPGDMELPDVDVLADQLRRAGLFVDPPRRIAPREPLTVVVGHRSAARR